MANSSSDISLLGKIASYTEILAKDAHSTAFVPLSDAYRQMGLFDDAVEVAEKGVKALPRFSPGYVILGRIHFDRGDMPAAMAAFERAHAIDCESLSAIKGLVRVLVQQGKHERAHELLEKAVKLNPEDPFIVKMQASLPRRPSRKAPVIAPAEAKKEKEPIATSTIADIYLKQGFPSRALKVYQDLQVNHPDNDELRQKIAEVAKLVANSEISVNHDNSVLSTPKKNANPAIAPVSSPILSPGADPVVAPVSPMMAIDNASLVDRQVEALNQWLTAIRGRRQHVLQ